MPANRRRGTFDPAYLNYTIGKLMIRKLREDWRFHAVANQPGKTFMTSF